MDRKRRKKGSNDDWTHPKDPDAKVTKMKDGRTRLAHKAEHAVDLETSAVVGVSVQDADAGDTRRTGLDEHRLGPDRPDPLPDGRGHELRPVVGAAVGRDAAQDEQVGQHIDDVGRRKPPPNPDCQALARELVEDIDCAKRPPVVGPVMNEVVGPDVVSPLRAQLDTRSVVEPQTTPFRLVSGHLQPLAPPQPLNPLVVDLPAPLAQQRCNPSVAVAAVLTRQLDHVRNQALFVATISSDMALG